MNALRIVKMVILCQHPTHFDVREASRWSHRRVDMILAILSTALDCSRMSPCFPFYYSVGPFAIHVASFEVSIVIQSLEFMIPSSSSNRRPVPRCFIPHLVPQETCFFLFPKSLTGLRPSVWPPTPSKPCTREERTALRTGWIKTRRERQR